MRWQGKAAPWVIAPPARWVYRGNLFHKAFEIGKLRELSLLPPLAPFCPLLPLLLERPADRLPKNIYLLIIDSV